MFRKIFIKFIRFYQICISPLFGPKCRHIPSCSHYAIQAIEKYGVIKGVWLGAKRVLKCHPLGTYGYDPVPDKESHK